MTALRCALACESWPHSVLFNICPQCGEPTRLMSNATPMPLDEAQILRNQLRFEEFYAEWCEKRGQSVDGPLKSVELIG